MAAEAVKDLFRLADRKGGGLFVMEGTEAFEVLTRLGQGHVAGYHVCDINSLLDLADDVLRNETVAHRRFYSCRSGDASNRATRRRTEGLENGITRPCNLTDGRKRCQRGGTWPGGVRFRASRGAPSTAVRSGNLLE